MIKYDDLINDILLTASKHKKVSSTGFGSTKEIGLDKDERTPLVWLQPIPISIQKPVNGYGSIINYKFDLIVMSQLEKDDANRKEIFAECLLIMLDIIHQLYNDEYNVNFNTDPTPFLENYDSESCGWITTLSIQDNYTIDLCNLPFNE